MKDKYFCRQILFIINQLAIIMYFLFLVNSNIKLPYNAPIQLGITTVLLFDAYYVSYKNIRNNTTLNKFSFLLTMVAWYFFLRLSFDRYLVSEICKILLSLIFFQALSFILSFLFQDNKYKYKNVIYIVMTVFCVVTIGFKFMSEYKFNFFLLMQFVMTVFILIFVSVVHRKRMVFILKNQKVQIFMSVVFVLVSFILYSLYFLYNAAQLENIGFYMICVLCFASVHSIIFCTRQKNEKHLSLAPSLKAFLVVLALLSAVLFGILFALPMIAVFILIYMVHALIQIYNMFLYLQAWKLMKAREHKYHDFYSCSLSGIRREEALKKEISEFLHDNVLQDLLSVKNLVSKSELPEIKQLMTETLEKLSSQVRLQMEQYHPVILKSLTLKENYQNLMEVTHKIFPLSRTEIVFHCSDDIFLADPYPVIIYRIMKELITNALKHAAAKKIIVNLSLKKDVITLEVVDDGMGFDTENSNYRQQKGLVSVYDTVYSLEGMIELKSKREQGTKVIITLPMKGEHSYESFISR